MAFPQTFDAYVPSDWPKLFAQAKITPTYIPFETLKAVPLDAEHNASKIYAERLTPPRGFAHSNRAYYFSLAILANGYPSNTPGVAQISFEDLVRRLYHTCILHDVGWTTSSEGRTHPANAMSFELHGGIMAYEHLLRDAPTLDDKQRGDIVQSIMLHTSMWPEGVSSTTKTLLSLSALFDLFGYDAQGPGSFDFLINRKTVQEIEKAFPRGELLAEGTEILGREFTEKPDCLLLHFPGGAEAFIKGVKKEALVPEDEVCA
ncbi:hypothetical protein HMN09_00798700 [Mycena chlorophos]|uniref:HD domain-containing protein n=1 Tax=Mycena chlorophos TaxID=658473 RepID=A0A8H6SUR1_MYCCL|nr:hypothetical protein HMN09_00798700 [Mycena chlorophos]